MFFEDLVRSELWLDEEYGTSADADEMQDDAEWRDACAAYQESKISDEWN